jgi:hypothetical protein
MWSPREANADEDEEREESSKRAGFHRYTQDEDTGKPLKSQGRKAHGLTAGSPVKYCPITVFPKMPRFFSPFVSRYASYWWWYGTATEGAASGV